MSNTIKETIGLIDEINSIIGEDRPVEPAFENEDPEGWCSVLVWEEQASQALADLLMVERRKNQKLQAENEQLKKQSQWISVEDFEKHLSDNDFCFVYFPCGIIKKCHLNDYRIYDGKGVYWQDMSGYDLPMLNTKFIKVDIPTPPEGE